MASSFAYMYGYQITQELQQRSEGYFEMKEGRLYPALHRMEQDGLFKSEWRSVAGSRWRKYYFITEEGRKVLAKSVTEWQTFIWLMLRGLAEEESMEKADGIVSRGQCWVARASSVGFLRCISPGLSSSSATGCTSPSS